MPIRSVVFLPKLAILAGGVMVVVGTVVDTFRILVLEGQATLWSALVGLVCGVVLLALGLRDVARPRMAQTSRLVVISAAAIALLLSMFAALEMMVHPERLEASGLAAHWFGPFLAFVGALIAFVGGIQERSGMPVSVRLPRSVRPAEPDALTGLGERPAGRKAPNSTDRWSDATEEIISRLTRRTWLDVGITVGATIVALILASTYLPPDLVTSAGVMGFLIGSLLAVVAARSRRQARDFLYWITASRDPQASGPTHDIPEDVELAHTSYLEAYQRFQDGGDPDIDPWRAAVEAIADPRWRTAERAWLALFMAVVAVDRDDPDWRQYLVEGRRRIVPFRLPWRYRLREWASLLAFTLILIAIAAGSWFIFRMM